MKRFVGALILLILERSISYSFSFSFWEWVGIQTLILTFVPFIIILIFGLKKSDFGLSMGEPGTWGKYVLILLIIALPFMIYGATLDSFKNYYPIWWPARQGIGLFIIFELGVLLMMFNTEFYFRGILLFSLEKITIDFKHGRIFTLLLHSLIYMIVHIGKPGLEVPYSFFVGIVFAWLALRTRSIFPSLAAHWISSVMFDAFILIQ